VVKQTSHFAALGFGDQLNIRGHHWAAGTLLQQPEVGSRSGGHPPGTVINRAPGSARPKSRRAPVENATGLTTHGDEWRSNAGAADAHQSSGAPGSSEHQECGEQPATSGGRLGECHIMF
jgi:hypothetical protein